MEETFTLTVNKQELDIVSAGLMELPYKIVAGLVSKFQGQLTAQTAPPPAETEA